MAKTMPASGVLKAAEDAGGAAGQDQGASGFQARQTQQARQGRS